MIWGLTLEPGKVYTEIVQDELQLSMAILECRKGISENESNFSHIVMKTYNTEYLLCTLVNGANYQQTLDLKIMPREKVTFSVQGNNTVYLVGYSSLCPDVSHDYEMGVDQDVPGWEEDYPGEDNEEHYTVQPQPITDDLDLEVDPQDENVISGGQTSDNRFQVPQHEEDEEKSGRISQEPELVYSVPDVEVVKEEPSSPHADLGDRLSPSGSLQSLDDPTTSGTEQQQHRDGTRFESYSASNTHPSASSWSMQSTVGQPSQSDPRFNPGQSASNPGQGTSSEGSTVYPVGMVGPSHPPAAFQNFQQSLNKRQRLETIFPPTQQTLNNSSGSQYPVPIHTGRVQTGLRQGPSTLSRRALGTPSMGALGPRSETVKQSLKSIIPRSGSANKRQHVPLSLLSPKKFSSDFHGEEFPGSEATHRRSANSDWVSTFSIPWEKMPELLLRACEKKQRPLPAMRREMVRTIVSEVCRITNFPGKKNLDLIAERIVNKYPASFRDEFENRIIGSGYSSLTKQMLNRVEHVNRKQNFENETLPIEGVVTAAEDESEGN